MVTIDALQGEVDARFGRLGLPSWADPHPDRRPHDDEYSRLTDPGRHVVVHERARVWAQVLRDRLGARVDRLPAEPMTVAHGQRYGFDRGVRVMSSRPGTLPLLLLERDGRDRPGDAPLPVLVLAVARTDVTLAQWPDCGCDACDSGSADLLEAVDGSVREVVGGPCVVLQGPGWGGRWVPNGGSAYSRGAERHEFRALMEVCRRLAAGEDVAPPDGTKAFVGRSWLG
ncbi:DUF6226 family protein [Actinotalea fermentans]|uniref:Uncharacterized protein n=1 Tax=Actinotalea fermentans TaxID=43671 RepID=A0A511YX79_9CELL|nr:DUF6226 family protein [Actinotalea fermentans]KGM16929.1 hypothetical protein N867_13070 [Actinotalea fermentans ATCC 43279 = JCM 9966 = DSM 3133]GEN79805.1 hypothetical protein AFE02nite_15390 [Actinotalea fermentans]